MKYAPIIIPTLNRYDHFMQCLESLEKCVDADKTDVYVALDYPPSSKYVEGWKENDAYLKEKEKNNSFNSLTVYRRETNYFFSGKDNSGTAIKDATLGKDRYIFSEDDNIFAPNFLVYMNACLEAYKDDDNVISVCGYSYPVEWDVDQDATCFRQQINSSAWGTGYWIDKVKSCDRNIMEGKHISMLPQVIAEKRYKKMIDACRLEYLTTACSPSRKLYKLMYKSTDMSIRMYLVAMNKYAITPVISKVRNIGFDGSGVYCQTISNGFGNTAGTYDYNNQPIDKETTFDLHEDSKHADEENRKRLNAFDYRSPEQMAKATRLLWLCEHVGIWSAKLYCLVEFPYEVAVRMFRKLVR